MDEQLRDCIDRLNIQNQVLAIIREAWLLKEAEKKHFDSCLVNSSIGKSHVDKLSIAQGLRIYLEFHQELAKLESTFQFEQLKFNILEKQYQALYLGVKTDNATISKQENQNRSW